MWPRHIASGRYGFPEGTREKMKEAGEREHLRDGEIAKGPPIAIAQSLQLSISRTFPWDR